MTYAGNGLWFSRARSRMVRTESSEGSSKRRCWKIGANPAATRSVLRSRSGICSSSPRRRISSRPGAARPVSTKLKWRADTSARSESSSWLRCRRSRQPRRWSPMLREPFFFTARAPSRCRARARRERSRGPAHSPSWPCAGHYLQVIDSRTRPFDTRPMRLYQLDKLGSTDGIILCERNEPKPGPTEIVVRVHAASLNKRDSFILAGTYPLPAKLGVVPLSDGAGEVVAAGDAVTRFNVGDRVAGCYFPRWRDGKLQRDIIDQLGCSLDGMLTEYALLDEQWAVKVPAHLSWEEAATLTCAGVTAWNSLLGPEPVVAGQTVLTLGTGGVSLFALQFAKLFGCRVISLTSSDAKFEKLRALGADHVLNYAVTPEWGQAVRDLTGGEGVDRVVETFGPDTIEQSMRASALHGQIVLLITRSPGKSAIEISGGAWASSMTTIRRVFVGSRASFEAMNRAIAASELRPVIDRVFAFEEAREAFHYFMQGQLFGKVVITGATA